MLLAGTHDGIYSCQISDEIEALELKKVHDITDAYRLYDPTGVSGFFCTAESGLYHSETGQQWSRMPTPAESVYDIAISPSNNRLLVGTRPSGLYEAIDGPERIEHMEWQPIEGFQALKNRHDWGIPRHDGISQIRSICIPSNNPNRLVVGVEVGGVYVSDDGGATWIDRSIDGFDAPHTDDIHHLILQDRSTFIASTGSGLYRTTDSGRQWTRLDTTISQQYFREAYLHGETLYAGSSSGSSATWNDVSDHILLTSADGSSLRQSTPPTTDEVAIGWTSTDDTLITATHRGSLFKFSTDSWQQIGNIGPDQLNRYLPLLWFDT